MTLAFTSIVLSDWHYDANIHRTQDVNNRSRIIQAMENKAATLCIIQHNIENKLFNSVNEGARSEDELFTSWMEGHGFINLGQYGK